MSNRTVVGLGCAASRSVHVSSTAWAAANVPPVTANTTDVLVSTVASTVAPLDAPGPLTTHAGVLVWETLHTATLAVRVIVSTPLEALSAVVALKEIVMLAGVSPVTSVGDGVA
jgi:hypothetical protein